MRAFAAVLCALSVAALGACGDKPQTLSAKKTGSPAFQGTGSAAYSASGWKPGDQASWDEQMRNRAQNQNEYSRASAN